VRLGRGSGRRARAARAASARFHGGARCVPGPVTPRCCRRGDPRCPPTAARGAPVKPAAGRACFDALRKANPEPRSALEHRTPFELLVAVILSAQATDASVNKATPGLFAEANTPEGMVALGLAGIKKHIKSIGLFNTKARNILEMSRILVREHGGEVPRDREALERLPGVGRKTANVVLNVAFGE